MQLTHYKPRPDMNDCRRDMNRVASPSEVMKALHLAAAKSQIKQAINELPR